MIVTDFILYCCGFVNNEGERRSEHKFIRKFMVGCEQLRKWHKNKENVRHFPICMVSKDMGSDPMVLALIYIYLFTHVLLSKTHSGHFITAQSIIQSTKSQKLQPHL